MDTSKLNYMQIIASRLNMLDDKDRFILPCCKGLRIHVYGKEYETPLTVAVTISAIYKPLNQYLQKSEPAEASKTSCRTAVAVINLEDYYVIPPLISFGQYTRSSFDIT